MNQQINNLSTNTNNQISCESYSGSLKIEISSGYANLILSNLSSIGNIKSLFFDTSNISTDVILTDSSTSFTYRLPNQSVGIIPIFNQSLGTFNFTSTSDGSLNIILSNIQNSSFIFTNNTNVTNSGNITVTDPVLDSLLSNPQGLPVNNFKRGNNDVFIPDYVSEVTFQNTLSNNTKQSIITPQTNNTYYTDQICIYGDYNIAQATAGINKLIISDSQNTNLLTIPIYIPSVANTIISPLVKIFKLKSLIKGKSLNTTLSVNLTNSLTSGNIYIYTKGGYTTNLN